MPVIKYFTFGLSLYTVLALHDIEERQRKNTRVINAIFRSTDK